MDSFTLPKIFNFDEDTETPEKTLDDLTTLEREVEDDTKMKHYKTPEEELPILNLKKTIEIYSQTSRFLKKRKHIDTEL